MSETTTVPPPAHLTALGQIIAEIVAPATVGFYDRDGQITAAHYQYWRSLSGGDQ